MGQPLLYLIQVLQKMLETEIKGELLLEIYKASLRRQHGSSCIVF